MSGLEKRSYFRPTNGAKPSSAPLQVEAALNYRHAFHAGNFADLVKHAILLDLLARLTAGREPLEVIDTHAGAGLYDLQGDAARMSGEAEAGIWRLMQAEDAPAAFRSLEQAVRDANPDGGLRLYPGSPLLAVRALRSGDSYTGCELRPDDADQLRSVLRSRAPRGVKAQALKADGYAVA